MIGLANRMSLSLGSSIAGAAILAEMRNFTTLVAAGTKHYTIPEFTLASGDVVEFRFQAPSATVAVTEFLLGGDVAGVNRAFFDLLPGGTFEEIGFNDTMLLDGNSVATNSTYPIDGKTHSIQLTANSTTIIGTIGARFNGVNTSNSVIYDFSITRGTDRKRFYKIDEDWVGPSTVLVDSGSDGSNGTAVNITSADSETFTRSGDDWLGVELISQALWEIPDLVMADWSFSSNQWVLTGSGGLSILRIVPSVSQPETMRIAGNCVSVTGTGVSATNVAGNADITVAGLYIFNINEPSDGFQLFKRISGVVNAVLDKPSLKRLLEAA